MKTGSITLLTAMIISICAVRQNKSQTTTETAQSLVALTFINDYITYCDKRASESGTLKWIENNALLTAKFKESYREMIEEARKREPELGLGFDPIFDAQDYPEEGFEPLNIDDEGYVTVRGKDWLSFTTVIKVSQVEDHWLVDGAGVVNIPQDKQRAR